MKKKEIEFELKGKARFYATDIVDAFRKLAEHFSNLARYCEDKKAGIGILGPGTDISIEPVKNKEK
ncbi:MAG TPA: hypothetical protein DCK79_03875 [Candidatus Atribacteria bacterium]|nr:MAG: hypothetical protein XE08_0157 [Parcubacteria bacterium 32_520]HAJ32494.1 hypothetical protein [Candidatus Atribacteria bacterium]